MLNTNSTGQKVDSWCKTKTESDKLKFWIKLHKRPACSYYRHQCYCLDYTRAITVQSISKCGLTISIACYKWSMVMQRMFIMLCKWRWLKSEHKLWKIAKKIYIKIQSNKAENTNSTVKEVNGYWSKTKERRGRCKILII